MKLPPWMNISEHFIGESIAVQFDTPPARLKTPPCPDGFTWRDRISG